MLTARPRSMTKSQCLAATAPGARNHALNRAPFGCSQFVAGGELETIQVIELLIDACHRNGLIKDDGGRSVMATIRSGCRAGRNFRARDLVPQHECTRAASLSDRASSRNSTGTRQPANAASCWWRRPAPARRSSRAAIIKQRSRSATSTCWCSRIAARSSARPATSFTTHGIAHGIIQAGFPAAAAGTRAGRVDPDACIGAPFTRETHGFAAGRSAGRSTKRHHCPARHLPQDHRRLSRRDPARPDGNAMPRRRARARRHLRDA